MIVTLTEERTNEELLGEPGRNLGGVKGRFIEKGS